MGVQDDYSSARMTIEGGHGDHHQGYFSSLGYTLMKGVKPSHMRNLPEV